MGQEVQPINRLISDPKDIQVLQIRYGIIRCPGPHTP